MSERQAPMPGFIREAHRRAKAAKTTPPEITQAPSTRTMTMLVRAGWDFRTRGDVRIWKKDDPTQLGGFWGWYAEEMAIEMQKRFDERKGSR